ncbi:short-chain dehydrogenase/reductase-like protein [Thozetella sp. PMI_491]|nr:short-chain dehydrogenase/reductase-like protein [Thozetella sp. PMI_491]
MTDLSKLPKDYYVTLMQFTKNTQQDVYPAIDPSKPEHSLTGKVVAITGASRGIGKLAMAPAFVKAGVRGVVLIATDAQKLAGTEEEVKKLNPAVETLTLAMDISDTKAVEDGFNKIKEKFGHADILINTAGVVSGDGPKLHETDPDAWWRNFEVNAKGNYLLVRSFLRLLPSPDTPAKIVLLSSWQAFVVVPPMSGYFISKFTVDQLATYVAEEYPNVTAVALHPGLVLTDMLREPFRSLFNQDSPELVGGTTVWLCQEKARFLSGRWVATNWNVDDVVAKKDEILRGNLLKLTLGGQFGPSAV